jgi:hypothetical protein
MNTTIASWLWRFYVVVLISLIATFVFEARLMEISTKGRELRYVLENQSTTSNVIHPRQKHSRKTIKFVKNGSFSLVPLCDCYFGLLSAIS